ncbi:MAG: hypothetical protein VR64_21880 [Desulfatitalea sp. BRH_c12]|nr:MAG: hypothetical protein VR64_21880 [Desulfatitalea sp. BRH_c12]
MRGVFEERDTEQIYMRYHRRLFAASAFQLYSEGFHGRVVPRTGYALGQIRLDAVQRGAIIYAARKTIISTAASAGALRQVPDLIIQLFFGVRLALIHRWYL